MTTKRKKKQLGSQGGLGYPRKSTRPHVLGLGHHWNSVSWQQYQIAVMADRKFSGQKRLGKIKPTHVADFKKQKNNVSQQK